MKSLHFALMKAHSCFSKRISARVGEELGLSSGQPKVLDCLLYCEGSDQKTIAANCEIEQATMGSILLRMEEKGLIERRQKTGNRRSWFVYLTDYGRETADKLQHIFKEEESRALRSFTEEQKNNICVLLEEIYDNINLPLEDGRDE